MTRILIAAVLAAAVGAPSAAHAATIHQDGPTPQRVLLKDDTGDTNLVTVEGTRSIVIHDDNAPITVESPATCMPLDPHTVSCAAVRHLDLDLDAGRDVATVASGTAVAIDGGPGDDRYTALATGAPSRVDFAGGPGLDTASYGFATAGVHVAVDAAAGDGRPGDDDRIRSDVESVLGSPFADVLAGGRRTVRLDGFDGDDRITGGTAAELLRGGRGDVRIDARDGVADTVDCGGQPLDRAAVDAEDAVTGCPTG